MVDDIDLYKRRIACVLDYFDDEREFPWNYVMRNGDGRFEAIVTNLYDDLGDKKHGVASAMSLGVFDDLKAAIKAVRDHVKRVDDASSQTSDGRLQ